MYFSASERLAKREPALAKVIAGCDELVAASKRDVRLTIGRMSSKLKADTYQVELVLNELAREHVVVRDENVSCAGCGALNDLTRRKCTTCNSALDKNAVEPVYMRISDPDGSTPLAPAKNKSTRVRMPPKSGSPSKRPSSGAPTPLDPWSVLKEAMERVPAVRYVLVPTALAAAGAIVISWFKGDVELALFTLIAAFVFTVVGFVFATGTVRIRLNSIQRLAEILMWVTTAVFLASVGLLFTRFFFGWPPKQVDAVVNAFFPERESKLLAASEREFASAARASGMIISNDQVRLATGGPAVSLKQFESYKDEYVASTDGRARQLVLDDMLKDLQSAVASRGFNEGARQLGLIISNGQVRFATGGRTIAFSPFEHFAEEYSRATDQRERELILNDLLRDVQAALDGDAVATAEKFAAAVKQRGLVVSNGEVRLATGGKSVSFAAFEARRTAYLQAKDSRAQELILDELVRDVQAAVASPPPPPPPPAPPPVPWSVEFCDGTETHQALVDIGIPGDDGSRGRWLDTNPSANLNKQFYLPETYRHQARIWIKGTSNSNKNLNMCVRYNGHGAKWMTFDAREEHEVSSTDSDSCGSCPVR